MHSFVFVFVSGFFSVSVNLHFIGKQGSMTLCINLQSVTHCSFCVSFGG